jgi:hypothetical protein
MRDLATIGEEMRAAQSEYFKRRQKKDLIRSKELEEEFDEVLERYLVPAKLQEPDFVNRKRAAEATLTIVGEFVGELGFALQYNIDEAVEEANLAEAAGYSLTLSMCFGRVGRWAASHAVEASQSEYEADVAETTEDAGAGDRGPTEDASEPEGDSVETSAESPNDVPVESDGGPTAEDLGTPEGTKPDAVY